MSKRLKLNQEVVLEVAGAKVVELGAWVFGKRWEGCSLAGMVGLGLGLEVR